METKSKIISFNSAIHRAQFLCARQERCSYDIKVKLKQWNVSPDNIEKVIAQLIKDGFINDERYVTMFVRDKTKFNKWGPIKIAQALRAKRIPDAIIQDLLKEIVETNDERILVELLKRKVKSIKAKSPMDLKSKLIRFGISRGFDYGIVLKEVDNLIKDNED